MIILTDTEGQRIARGIPIEELKLWTDLGWIERHRESGFVLIEWECIPWRGGGRPPPPPEPKQDKKRRRHVEHWTDKGRDDDAT